MVNRGGGGRACFVLLELNRLDRPRNLRVVVRWRLLIIVYALAVEDITAQITRIRLLDEQKSEQFNRTITPVLSGCFQPGQQLGAARRRLYKVVLEGNELVNGKTLDHLDGLFDLFLDLGV